MGSSALRSSGCGHDGAAARGAAVDLVHDPVNAFADRALCVRCYAVTVRSECALLLAGEYEMPMLTFCSIGGMTPALMAPTAYVC